MYHELSEYGHPAHDVGGAKVGLQPGADLGEDRVAKLVAVAVVDPLEVVQVDEQQGAGAAPAGALQVAVHRLGDVYKRQAQDGEDVGAAKDRGRFGAVLEHPHRDVGGGDDLPELRGRFGRGVRCV